MSAPKNRRYTNAGYGFTRCACHGPAFKHGIHVQAQHEYAAPVRATRYAQLRHKLCAGGHIGLGVTEQHVVRHRGQTNGAHVFGER